VQDQLALPTQRERYNLVQIEVPGGILIYAWDRVAGHIATICRHFEICKSGKAKEIAKTNPKELCPVGSIGQNPLVKTRDGEFLLRASPASSEVHEWL
jgi:hypothetical protein